MQGFGEDIFDVAEEATPTPSQIPPQASLQMLQVLVDDAVDKKVKQLKKKFRQREEELIAKLEVAQNAVKKAEKATKKAKKATKKAKAKNSKKVKKNSDFDGLFMKAAHVSIESGLPVLFRNMSAESRRKSKKDRDDE